MICVLVVWSFCKRREIRGAKHNRAPPGAFPATIHKDERSRAELIWCNTLPRSTSPTACPAALASEQGALELPWPRGPLLCLPSCPLALQASGEGSSGPHEGVNASLFTDGAALDEKSTGKYSVISKIRQSTASVTASRQNLVCFSV